MSQLETAARELIEAHQLARLQVGLQRILTRNTFYTRKYMHSQDTLKMRNISDLKRLPFTRKQEFIDDQTTYPPFGHNLTSPLNHYIRLHRTSGTSGHPLTLLDTQEGWDWWADCWTTVYEGAGVTRNDIVYLAFNFGPFIGFWAAYEGSKRLGALTVPGGGLDALQRLYAMQELGATVLICTPSYALRLAEVAQENGIDLGQFAVRVTIHAGEPGASIPAIRQRIERAWHARTYDHAGMAEMGAYGFSCAEQTGLHVNEGEFIAEIIKPGTDAPVQPGEVGELVLTNLGRWGYPALRYRTGDLVKHGGYNCPCGRSFLLLPGGVLARTEDVLIIRGINVYPSALTDVLYRFPAVQEYRVVVTREGLIDEITLQVECSQDLVPRLQEELRSALNLRIPIEAVARGSLPRFEMTAMRIDDRRSQANL